ncbi:FG-GAP-like repeat-containing protein [Streptomyces sp. NPDC002073]|uniref:FG-GAP-like repeat-containing protein n=1 Tax=Streptomyces sp. NBC_00239 TaxID=2903640 RepID=UPI002E2B5F66|nr:FG-GAP-like repeat-containing protein [Streptomyces sp. NBC_00239]
MRTPSVSAPAPRRTLTALATAALAALATAVLSAPAQAAVVGVPTQARAAAPSGPATAQAAPAAPAATGYDRCTWGSLCVFSGPVGQGEMLVVKGGRLDLGSWNNRISSYVNHTSHPVCFHPEPGLAPTGAVHFYTGRGSFDESASPELDNAVSSLDTGPEADWFCGTEARHPVFQWEGQPKPRPKPVPAGGAFGDLDGDGYGDLLARNKFGQLWTAHADPGTARTALVGGGWNSMTKLTRHGDFTSDGREDLLARDTAGVLWCYPGKGNGAFGTRTRVGAGWNAMRDLAAAGDLTGDGRADLLAADTDGTLWTYPGNGKGAFTARKKVGGGWKAFNELVGAGDVNSDKRADLVARDTAGRLWLYPGNGRGAFGARALIGSGGWSGLTELAGAGDLTGDGRPDLIAHAPKDNGIRVYPVAADGTLRSPYLLAGSQDTHLVF